MCTLSIITREDGYRLGMNRDERTSRGPAAPPEIGDLQSVQAAYPRDIEGGTWIGINDQGITLALLNWTEANDAAERASKTRSRGFIIPELLGLRSLLDVEARLQALALGEFLPFRLIGVFRADRQMREWTWDRARLGMERYGWARRHWFSSGLSQAEAETWRGASCRQAWSEEGAGSAAWLRRLHSAHVEGPGAFSICVHREGVKTVSYTEVACDAESISLGYFPGSPCQRSSANAWHIPAGCTLPVDISRSTA